VHKDEYNKELRNFYNTNEYSAKVLTYIVLSICTLIEGILMFFTVKLLFFHYWLNKEAITTYDYIIYLKERPNGVKINPKIRNFRTSKVLTKVNDNSNMHLPDSKDNSNLITQSPPNSHEPPLVFPHENKELGRKVFPLNELNEDNKIATVTTELVCFINIVEIEDN